MLDSKLLAASNDHDGRLDQPGNGNTSNQLRSSKSMKEIKATSGRRIHFASEDDLHAFPLSSRPIKRTKTRVRPSMRWDPFSLFTNPFRSSSSSSSSSASVTPDDSDYLRPNAFPGHRDTLARIQRRTSNPWNSPHLSNISSTASSTPNDAIDPQNPYPYRPSAVNIPALVLADIDHLADLLQVENQTSNEIDFRKERSASLTNNNLACIRLPHEVLQVVFADLAPNDFESARHACKDWYFAGLDVTLLRSMLRRAGCRQASKIDFATNSAISGTRSGRGSIKSDKNDTNLSSIAGPSIQSNEHVDRAWMMAKRLSTEIKLSAQWRGSWQSHNRQENNTKLHLREEVYFQKILSRNNARSTRLKQKAFTVSTCGKYILVQSDHKVFVYRLEQNGATMTAIVRLVAERNILKLSMDTSSRRYAVAALLEGRVGVFWDIPSSSSISKEKANVGESMSLGMHADVRGSEARSFSPPVPQSLPLRRPEFGSFTPSDASHSSEIPSRQDVPSQLQRTFSDSKLSHQMNIYGVPLTFCSSPESEIEDPVKTMGFPIQIKPLAKYTNLGCQDDLPRSVAICPQRKCVAFGCRMGIELHWIDALTGGDLNRWFPLAAPSDYLYFLPQRPGVDSTKKLRLISSAAGDPSPALSRSGSAPMNWIRRAITHDRGRRQSITRLFFGNLPFPSATTAPADDFTQLADDERHGVLRAVDCDHYRAIPLSDGFHLLFTDPHTGHLCLGSDAPLGGPTKLVRKVVFIPPSHEECVPDSNMTCYNVGADLQWGVRVVSAHEDGRLILYNVPSDYFKSTQHSGGLPDAWDEQAGVLAQSDLLMDEFLTPHTNSSMDPDMGNDASREDGNTSASTTPRSIQVYGSVVGYFGEDAIEDISVDCSAGGFKVWVFCKSGIARLLTLYLPPGSVVRRRYAGVSGLLHERSASSPSCPDTRCNSKGKERARSDDEAEDEDDERSEQYVCYGFDGTNDPRDCGEVNDQNFEPEPEDPKNDEVKTEFVGGFGKCYLEILAFPVYDEETEPLHLEILTDWRGSCLLCPYIVLLE